MRPLARTMRVARASASRARSTSGGSPRTRHLWYQPWASAREFLEVAGDPVRLAGRARPAPSTSGNAVSFLSSSGPRARAARRGARPRPRRPASTPGHAEDAAHPGVRHLHVEDRVLVGLALGQVEVEVELRVPAAHQEEVARGVRPDLVDQVAQRDELAGPLRHLHLVAAPQHLHQLHQRHVEEARPGSRARGARPAPAGCSRGGRRPRRR